MNKLFNGTANVFIKSKSNRTIMGKEYEKDDIIAYLERVQVTMAFNENVSAASKGGNLLAISADSFPTMVVIEEIVNTSALEKLLYTPSQASSLFTITEVFKVEDLDEGKAFLSSAVEDILSYSKVRSYSNTGEKISVTFNEDDLVFTFEDYEEYDYIRVFLTVNVDSKALAMERVTQEYVYLEIQLEGKRGMEQGYYLISIPAAQLVSSPQYEFSDRRLQYGNQLTFMIIKNNLRNQLPTLTFVRE